jgi:hypothetical protein
MNYIGLMNTERVFKIMVMELSNSILKIEEDIEVTINSDLDINDKVKTIKKLLVKLTNAENSFNRFTSMMPNEETNNNN